MKLTLNAAELHQALSMCLATNSPMEILKHVGLDADGVNLCVTSTDTEKWLRTELLAEVAAAGRCTADATMLKAAVAGVAGQVSLSLEGNTLHVQHEHGRFTLTSLDPDDMYIPDLSGSWETMRDLTPDQLREAIHRHDAAAHG